jgi:antitoxin VapB
VKKIRIVKSGRSQSIRLPRQFHFRGKEVEILRRGDEIILREPMNSLSRAFEALASLPRDFMADGRNDTPPQERKSLNIWSNNFGKKR